MLSQENRLHRSSDFRRVVRTGVKVTCGHVVVYAARQDNDKELAASVTGSHPHSATSENPPRVGLIVSKAVGNAVVRHRTSRRLRHVCMTFIPKLPASVDVVIRALPASATASSEQLEKDLAKALRKQWDI